MKSIVPCLYAVLFLAAAAPAADAPTSPYRMKEGETLPELAARVLGSADLAGELLQLNQIEKAEEVKPGMLLALPGPERKQALDRIADARKALDQARAGQADQWSPAEWTAATRGLAQAEKALAAASYSKAAALASVAASLAAEAGRLAGDRARVTETARLATAAGDVAVKSGADDWAPAAGGRDLKPGDKLRVATGGLAELKLPDASVLRLEGGELTVKALDLDRRANVRRSQLQVANGRLSAKLATAATELSAGRVAWSGAGSESFSTVDAESGLLLVTRDGTVQVQGAGAAVPLPAGSGLRAGTDGRVGPVRAVPGAPKLADTWSRGLKTGVSRVVLAWDPLPGAAVYDFEVGADEQFARVAARDAVGKPGAVTTALEPGHYSWRVRARTEEGLTGPWSESGRIEVVFDLSAKVDAVGRVVKRGEQHHFAPGVQAKPLPAAEATSIVRYERQAADGSWVPVDREIVFTEGGRHQIRIRGVAPDGRTGEPVEATVLVDDLPPGLRVTFDPPERVKDGPRMRMMLEAADPAGVAEIDYRIKGKGWPAGDGSFVRYEKPVQLDKPGRFTLEVRARDALGNEATAEVAGLVPQ
jgi:hypothetical protein